MRPRVLLSDVRGSGPTVVLIPGGLTGWVSWEPHQLRLADSFRVIRVQPIHNELGSAGVPGDPGYTAEVEQESLRLTLEHLEVDSAALAGWSRGGGTALEYALLYPENVRSLTLIEPEVSWVLDVDDSSSPGKNPEDQTLLDEIVGRDVSEDDLARLLVLFGMAADPDQARAHPVWGSWVQHRNALSWPYQESSDPQRSAADLVDLQLPVLLVKGNRSSPRDRTIVDSLRHRLPVARVLELDGGHASHIESLDEFIEQFTSHLNPRP